MTVIPSVVAPNEINSALVQLATALGETVNTTKVVSNINALIGEGANALPYNWTPPYQAGEGTWALALNSSNIYLELRASLVSGSLAGGVAGYFLTRQSDNDQLATDPVPIGVAALSYNNVVGLRGAWGGYIEGHRILSSGSAVSLELEAINYGNEATQLTPYGVTGGVTNAELSYGLGIGCGGGLSTPTRYDSTAAMYVTKTLNNDARFKKGIVFIYSALTGATSDGTGRATAIEMAAGHEIVWKYGILTNSIAGKIRASETNNAAGQQRLVFENGAFKVRGVLSNLTTEHDLFSILAPTLTAEQTGTNTIVVSPSATAGGGSGTAQILAAGPDTNINIMLTPKGTGVIDLHYAAIDGTITANKYINVLENGVAAKIAIEQ